MGKRRKGNKHTTIWTDWLGKKNVRTRYDQEDPEGLGIGGWVVIGLVVFFPSRGCA